MKNMCQITSGVLFKKILLLIIPRISLESELVLAFGFFIVWTIISVVYLLRNADKSNPKRSITNN